MSFRRLYSQLRQIENGFYSQPVPRPTDTIIVAMSGGVDSSVCASLYAKKYSNVKGVFMQNWSSEAKCSERDWNDVKKVADHLQIPCERVNFEKDYWQNVFSPMIEGYKKGLTPNPDVNCNKYIKFGRLLTYLNEKYGDTNSNWWLVTGHYARVMRHVDSDERHLLRGIYRKKDQSFYLSSLPFTSLKRLLLPIGHYTKPEVRQIAKDHELPSAERPDSQGLCFVSQQGNFRDFLNEYIPPNPGNIITEDGVVRGAHGGLWHATVGQRSGISMPQGDPDFVGKWYVSEKRFDTNELVIVKGGDNPRLYKNYLEVTNWEWLGDMNHDKLPPTEELTLQFRSLQEPVKMHEISFDSSTLKIKMKSEEKGVAQGQSLVLYHNERVLGCGVISKTAKI